MIRAQFSFDEQDYEAAKMQARDLAISLAELVRRALRDKPPVDSDKPWMRYAGMVQSGDPDASVTIDDVIYGVKAH